MNTRTTRANYLSHQNQFECLFVFAFKLKQILFYDKLTFKPNDNNDFKACHFMTKEMELAMLINWNESVMSDS